MRIQRIEWARLAGERPRAAGCNARLGEHGLRVTPGAARVWADNGAQGWGWCHISRDDATSLVGAPLDGAWEPSGGLAPAWRALEYPLLDLAGKAAGLPVYALVSRRQPTPSQPLHVPCYDTSLYMDDLHLPDDAAGAEWMAGEARQGWARGHRAFKLKVGRGALHMEPQAGLRRDIAVIRAVRAVIGPRARLMIDANNGYTLNLLKQVLTETADCQVYWIEEPFHEDGRLYTLLQEWLAAQGLATLIADGEGDASPRLLDWARDGLVDVVQYDIRVPGFSRWLELGPQLDGWSVHAGPHHYGGGLGNYAACHLAPAIAGFEAAEWDEAAITGVDASGYAIADGLVSVPDAPGFGLTLDEGAWQRAMSDGGWRVE